MVKWLSIVVIFALTACSASRLTPQLPSAASNSSELTPQVVQKYGEHLWTVFPDANGVISGQMAADRNGNVYVFAENGIDEINYSGTRTHTFDAGVSNLGIPWWNFAYNGPPMATTADGSVWATMTEISYSPPYVGMLVRITPQGVEHIYQTGIQAVDFGYMTAGFGSDLWYIDFGGLHHFNYQTGALQSYAVPFGPAGFEEGITKGPDGNIWYLTYEGYGRVTPTGNVTYHNVGVDFAPGEHTGIIAGPNGHLFTIDQHCLSHEIATNGQIVGSSWFGERSSPDIDNCSPQPLVTRGAIWDVACAASTTYLLEWQVQLPGEPVTKTAVPNSLWGKPCYSASSNAPAGGTVGSDGNLYFNMQNGLIGIRILDSITVSPYVSLYTFPAPGRFLTLTVSETNYSGAWTAGTTQPTVVRAVKWLSRTQVQIESVGKGSGRIIIRDNKDNYYSFFVSVQ